ncbi:MAG: 6-carboxytetrahydropterin synthase [Vampirovibrionales bacterium]|nr:6-carboxytetrahydropterin synthase [Vampirovibrionales bacterium]
MPEPKTTVAVTRRAQFCAAHYYWRDDWSEAENQNVFKACSNRQGHGHNYKLAVTVSGPLDANTGMVVNLRDLKKLLKQHVLETLDHKHLNHQVFALHETYRGKQPTLEHLASYIWESLNGAFASYPWQLTHLALFETEDLFVELVL